MNYQETISFLYDQLPVYQKYGASAIKKDLTNIRLLCDDLGNPQDSWPAIHIAGTNGKGTVSHMIAAILQAQGLKVGLYTSPHYTDFRERIKVNGEWVSENFITEFVSTHLETVKRITPSFFEITVAMAFDYFRSEEVDIAIIETGLGGRLDSTNIINPLISVITHISLDHMHMLGDNIYQIAHEKAGIIKEATPTVIGRYQTDCDAVFFKKIREKHSAISFASLKWDTTGPKIRNSENPNIDISISDDINNESPFFIENAKTAIEAISQYQSVSGIDITLDSIETGLKEYRRIANYIGRWQILNTHPTTIADSAHNQDALQKVLSRLSLMKCKRLRIVIGFVQDKDVDKILDLFPTEAEYYFVAPSIFRALSVITLSQKAKRVKLIGQSYESVAHGYHQALADSEPEDLIFVGGSSFVVGDLLAELAEKDLED